MKRTVLNAKVLKGASRAAQKAFDAYCDPNLATVPEDEKIAWAMAAIIYCDICRLLVAYQESDHEGLAKFLFSSDIVSKLFEAKRWYFEKGDKLLRSISNTKKCGETKVRKRLIKMRQTIKIGKIESYANYRNKFGYHYDADALKFLVSFSKEDSNAFLEILRIFALFSGEWAKLTKSLIRDEL